MTFYATGPVYGCFLETWPTCNINTAMCTRFLSWKWLSKVTWSYPLIF